MIKEDASFARKLLVKKYQLDLIRKIVPLMRLRHRILSML